MEKLSVFSALCKHLDNLFHLACILRLARSGFKMAFGNERRLLILAASMVRLFP